MFNLPISSLSPSRLPAIAGGVLLAIGLAGCSIPLTGQDRTPVGSDAAAAVPPPPGMAQGATAAGQKDRGAPITQAQTFRGVIPCADCEGIRVTLTLQPDWTWRMRRVYFGTRDKKEASFVTTGRWERGLPGTNQIRLIGDRNESGLYDFVSGNTLRMLDQDGQAIQSSLNYLLTQQFELDPIADTFSMRGKVVSTNGATTFAICSTGKTYPVSQAAQGKQLADAYSRLRIATGTPVLMWIEGSVQASGEPPREQIIVQALTRGTLDSPCED